MWATNFLDYLSPKNFNKVYLPDTATLPMMSSPLLIALNAINLNKFITFFKKHLIF